MRTRGIDGDPVVGGSRARFVRGLIWLEAHGTLIIGAGVAITGIGMLLILGAAFLEQPWLLLALSIYATILLVSFFVQRPGVRRLLGLKEAATEEEKERWRVARPPPALHQLRHGRRHRPHRLAHDEQAHVLSHEDETHVTRADLPVLQDHRGRDPVRHRARGRAGRWPSTTSTRSRPSIS